MKLNVEQSKLVKNKSMGHNLIRGIAGSGKTTVGICRISYLLEKHANLNDKVLFLTYNKSLSKYIQHLYNKVEKENNNTLSFFDEEKKEKNKNVKVTTVDSIIYSYFMNYCRSINKSLYVEWNVKVSIFSEAIERVKERYSEITIIQSNNLKFLRDEISWIKACNYMTLEEYQNADRIGRAINNNEGPSKLYKNSKNREAIFCLMVEVDKLLEKENKVDGFTQAILALNYIKKKGAYAKYKHIIIDEAQDLTKVQLEFINFLREQREDSSILFLTDVAQSIYPQAWLVKGRSFTSIGYDMTGKGSKLSKNYRTTTEIAEAAYSLLSKDPLIVEDENFVKPSLMERSGEYPVYRHFKNSMEEHEYLVKLIKGLNKTYSLKDMAIVSRINKNLELLKDKLINSGISATLINGREGIDFDEENVKLTTMHSVKGLEFKIVIIIDINSDQMPFPQKSLALEEIQSEESRDRKLLYVGMTRATEKLFLCSYGEASKFLNDINHRLLLMQCGSKMGSYYNIPYEEYKFKDKLQDVKSEEESVRQWIINELMTSYGYPKELIEIEYNVRNFSKEGKVDIAVINGRTNEPYILVEVKKKGINIEEAVNQLKSYMNVSKSNFGIASNGEEIVFLDNNFICIRDIPICATGILKSSIERYKYVDKINNVEREFERDINYTNEIISEEKIIPYSQLKTVKVYADIAAGIPIEINDEIKGSFNLPMDWIRNKENVFLLHVKGNSMINAGINNGDLVLIESAQTADNMEIVAAYYNGATTLKRIVRMGDTVLLMSENPEYEPINITEGELRVMGKLIGVLSQVEKIIV